MGLPIHEIGVTPTSAATSRWLFMYLQQCTDSSERCSSDNFLFVALLTDLFLVDCDVIASLCLKRL